MNTEDGESVISEVSTNTDKIVFNGGISGKHNIKNDNNVKLDINHLERKLTNGNKKNFEPISFRPNNVEALNNYSIDIDNLNLQNEYEMEENVFTNLKEKIIDSDNVNVTCRNEGSRFKSINSNIINCTISSIEKGIVILVTQNDTIFTLPAFFLPKNSIPGNSYQITIDETVKLQFKVGSIQSIQNKFKHKENNKLYN
jgi:hypothetical protein